MITPLKFALLAPFQSASWALWSNNFDDPNCIEAIRPNIFPFLANHINQLIEDIILLGINRAPGNGIQEFHPFYNFHTVPHRGDSTLKAYIQGNNLQNIVGSYMTDLNSEIINPVGNQVPVGVNNFQLLTQQLEILGTTEFNIVCFGNDSFNGLLSFLPAAQQQNLPNNIILVDCVYQNIHLNIYRVWHYSDRGYNHDNVLELQEQLLYLNGIF